MHRLRFRLHRADVGRLLELVGVSAIACAQPVLGALGESPERFLVVGAGRTDIVVFGLIVVVVPPVAVWIVGLALGVLSSRAKELWQALGVGMFVALLLVLALRDVLSIGFVTALVAALLLWFGAAVLYEELPPVRAWPRYLSAAAPAVLALFLFLSPVGDLVLPTRAAAVARVEGNGAPVFMLVFDEFPLMTLVDEHGEIDASLFPNFARLASEGSWYRNATTVHGLTQQAVPALLSGRYPRGEVTAPSVSNHPRSLFTLLADSYDLHVREHFQLCPSSACTDGSRRGGDAIDELLGDARAVLRDRLFPEAEPLLSVHGWDPQTAQADVRVFEELLAEIGPADRERALFFQHVMLPHARFQYLPDGTRYNDPSPFFGLLERDDYLWLTWSSEETARLALVRHRLQAMWADEMVGRLLDRLDEHAIYDDALVVVTADHGVSLTAGESHRAVVDTNYSEILWVPLFVKSPGSRAGRTIDANVETIDLLPTMTDALDIALPWEIDGVVAGGRAGREKRFFGRWNTEDFDDGYEYNDTDGLAAVRSGVHAAPDDAPDALRAYSTGVLSELLGQPVEDFTERSTNIAHAFDEPDAWRDVDVDASVIPAYLSGRLRGLDEPAVLAVAVNGTIAATGRTFSYDGEPARFAMMIPPALLREGRNDIELYAVDTTSPAPALASIGSP